MRILSRSEGSWQVYFRRSTRLWRMRLCGADRCVGGTTISTPSMKAALRGDCDTAIELIGPVLGGLYDNVLTPDMAKRKVDKRGRLCRVPRGSPPSRYKPYRDVGDEKYCLNVPEQYNHGTAVAQSAIAAHRTIETIDWGRVKWNLTDLEREDYMANLWEYIRANDSRWVRKGLSVHPEKTGENERDSYPGKKGTEWYTWKYRDLKNCKRYRGSKKDRPQDISKGSKEISFITDFIKWANGRPSGGNPKRVKNMYVEKDIHRLVVTFLNRLTRGSDGKPTERFACDIHGTVEGDPEVFAPKSYEGRGLNGRAPLAAAWMSMAWGARDFIKTNRTLECDVNSMVKTVLPLAMQGNSDFFRGGFRKRLRDWASELIMAKYYYFNYDFNIVHTCSGSNNFKQLIIGR